MPPRTSALQTSRARKLRRDQTIAKELLWRSLRNNQLGVKFRRQVPVGVFIADFACVAAKLIVEVDGPSHESDAGQAKDAWRDRWFADNGWRVVRVSNALVIGGGDLAIVPIKEALNEGCAPSPG